MAGKKKAKKKKAAKPKKALKKKVLKKGVKKKAGRAARTKKVIRKAAKKTAARKVAKKTGRVATAKAAAPKTRRLSPALQKRHEILKRILLQKRNEVVGKLEMQMGRKLVFDAGQKVDSAMDSADQSAQDVDAGIDYSLLEMKYEQFKDIADAFRKLQNNTYGLCEECGEEIDIKRLEVNPLARYCITCKTRREEMEKIQKEENRFKE
jgi:DnaK suppressor protein